MSAALSRWFILLKNTISQLWHPIWIARFYTFSDSCFKFFLSTCISKSHILKFSKQSIKCFLWIFRKCYPKSWDTLMENNRNFSNDFRSYDPNTLNHYTYLLTMHKNRLKFAYKSNNSIWTCKCIFHV